MALPLRLMDSFSSRDRFIWHNNTFSVMIPKANLSLLHARASPAQLKALLAPEVRRTRAGNVSNIQLEWPSKPPYDFWLAQLVHYGLDFHFDIEAAKRAVEVELRLRRLQVPKALADLERELREEHSRVQQDIQLDSTSLASKATRKPTERENRSTKVSLDTRSAKTTTATSSARTRAARHKKKHRSVSKAKKSRSPRRSPDHGRVMRASDRARTSKNATIDREDTSSGSESPSSPEISNEESHAHTSGTVKCSSSRSDSGMQYKPELSNRAEGHVEQPTNKKLKFEKGGNHGFALANPANNRTPSPPRVGSRLSSSEEDSTSSPESRASRARRSDVVNVAGSRSFTPTQSPAAAAKSPSGVTFLSPDRRPSWTIPVRSSPRLLEGSEQPCTNSNRSRSKQVSFGSTSFSPRRDELASSHTSEAGGKALGQPFHIRHASTIGHPPSDAHFRAVKTTRDDGTHLHKRKRNSEAEADIAARIVYPFGGLDGAANESDAAVKSPSNDNIAYDGGRFNDAKPTNKENVLPASELAAPIPSGFIAINTRPLSKTGHDAKYLLQNSNHKAAGGGVEARAARSKSSCYRNAFQNEFSPEIEVARSRGSLVRAGLVF